MVRVFRSGEQGPIDVSNAVLEYIEKNRNKVPEGIEMAAWFDTSEFYSGRVDLLKRNALIGLCLVFIVLSLFLEIKLAFWVTLGIPITFIGAFIFLPSADVSINMISLFAFIVVLGMVVDDAIIVGEAVYKQRQDGHGPLRAAIRGAKEVAVPVSFAILTTIFAFMPMLFVPGPAGKFFRVIPLSSSASSFSHYSSRYLSCRLTSRTANQAEDGGSSLRFAERSAGLRGSSRASSSTPTNRFFAQP